MSEAIAFVAGLIAMAVVWFINDTSPDTSPYRRGFDDGYRQAMVDSEVRNERLNQWHENAERLHRVQDKG